MWRTYFAIVFGGTFLCLAIGSLLWAHSEKPASDSVVVLDDRWNVNYAEGSCASADSWNEAKAKGISDPLLEAWSNSAVEECRVGSVGYLNAFEFELATHFAANTGCKGVQFVRFSGPHKSDPKAKAYEAMQGDYWRLTLDYRPGAQKQEWIMKRHEAPAGVITSGKGDSSEIAQMVCSIVTQRGAKLVN